MKSAFAVDVFSGSPRIAEFPRADLIPVRHIGWYQQSSHRI